MWKQRVKKFIDNPFVALSYLRNRLWYRFIADKISSTYRAQVNFISGAETIAKLVEKDTSLIRIGDGTFGYLMGSSIYFNSWQFVFNRAFNKKLREALKQGQGENILFCVPHTFITKSKGQFASEGIKAEWPIWTAAKVMLKDYLIPGHTYGDATCFHPRYNPNINFLALKKYLDTKHVIIATSGLDRFKELHIGKSTTLVEAPSSDAWQVYKQLENAITTKIKELGLAKNETLIMISAAEAAKVMIYNLSNQGYTAWDTGQFFDLAAKEFALLEN